MSVSSSTPKDAQVMGAILRDMGVNEYEPRVISQMLEFAYRYMSDVLDDAKVLCDHAGKRSIDVDDIKLAVEAKLDWTFTQPPPRELLLELAAEKNSVALPPIKQQYGLRLPPDRFCLVQPNYRLKGRAYSSFPSRTTSSSTTPASTLPVRLPPPPPYRPAPPATTASSSVPSPRPTPRPSAPQQELQLPGGPIFRLTPAPHDTNRKRKADEANMDEDYDA